VALLHIPELVYRHYD